MLPPSNILPRTYRDLSSTMEDIGMYYQEIHACPNEHVIYYNKHGFATKFPEFHITRYRIDQVTKNVPHKVLRYISIIPRLQRLSRCKKTVQFMDYHVRNRSQDDVNRMPIDGTSFRDIEEKWPHFKEEPRNLRIYLATDGVNPFSQMKSIYTVWPIFVINNNIPPWLPIKREHIMLLMIIPGILCLQLFYR